MKHILLLFAILLAGCAVVPTETLIQEAKECVATSHNDKGVIGASSEQSTACWEKFNKHQDAVARREEREEKRKAESCRRGYVKFCNSWGRCGCMTDAVFRDWLRRNGL